MKIEYLKFEYPCIGAIRWGHNWTENNADLHFPELGKKGL
jgi:hypothetical protein